VADKQATGKAAVRIIEALRTKEGDPIGDRALGDALADQVINQVRRLAQLKLAHTKDLFPQFTDHSIQHSDGVVEILDWLVPDGIKAQLNAWELYFLLAAAYLHDLGMIEGCPDLQTDPQWQAFLTAYLTEHPRPEVPSQQELTLAAKRAYVRDTHHERSEQYIMENAAELGLNISGSPAEAQIVARISKGHRRADLGDQVQFGVTTFGNNQLIRRDLLAAYLRLADELDTTAMRTPIAEFEVLNIDDEVSALEWAKHLAISGVSAHEGVITIAGRCFDHRVFLRLQKLSSELRGKLRELKAMLPRPYATLDGFLLPDPIPYHDVELRLEHTGYLPIEISFQLEHEGIMNLLMGERLYGDKSAWIRELLQNGVDTCREAVEQRPASYVPRISVTESPDRSMITISDNGMGMDEHIVRSYFARLGLSYYKSSEFSGHFRPISEFGIGVLSCFMVADRIEVDSKRNGSEPIWFEITSLVEPFLCRRGTGVDPGTNIRLHLGGEVPNWDLVERVRHFAGHVDIPIEVTTHEGRVESIGGSMVLPWIGHVVAAAEELAQESGDWLDERISGSLHNMLRHQASLALGRFSISLSLDGINISAVFPPGGPLYEVFESAPSKASRGRLYQDGFLVRDLVPNDIRVAHGSYVEINLTGASRASLSVDRTRTVNLPPDIGHHLISAYCAAVEDVLVREYGDLTSDRWWSLHAAYIEMSQLTASAEIFEKSALEHARFCILDHNGFHSESIEDVHRRKGLLIFEDDLHEVFSSLYDKIPQNTSVLFSPRTKFETSSPFLFGRGESTLHMVWRLLSQPSDLKRVEYREIYELLNAEVSIHEVAGITVAFVDAGRRIGPPILPLDSIRREEGGFHPICWDIHHPLGNVLHKCVGASLPTALRAAVALFISSFEHNEYGRPELHPYFVGRLTEFVELSEDLVELGVIQSSDLPDQASVFEVQLQGHSCPYGLTYGVFISPRSGYPWRREQENGGDSIRDQPNAKALANKDAADEFEDKAI
jgi:hypothetical protein